MPNPPYRLSCSRVAPGNYHFFFSLIRAALARHDIQKPANLTASPGLLVDFEEHSFLRVGSSPPRESREKPAHSQDLRYKQTYSLP